MNRLLATSLARLVLTALVACVPARAEVDGARQRALIDAAVATLPARDAAAPARVFFLGFAGFGEERVFAEEIKMAARQVGQRFGAPPALLLINDRRDLTTHPLATHANLKYAIKALAAVMDTERDVLFLAMSSHGSRNGLIEVSNTGMEVVGIGGGTVARYLEEAGIRWKVVVVSACFSGAFIDPLADNRSIVITAASRHRASFGCSDDRHLTYFGEAFYRDALPGARTLRGAFENTRQAIREREKEERVTPSQPQSYFGPMMESRLDEIMAPAEAMAEKDGAGERLPLWAVSHR